MGNAHSAGKGKKASEEHPVEAIFKGNHEISSLKKIFSVLAASSSSQSIPRGVLESCFSGDSWEKFLGKSLAFALGPAVVKTTFGEKAEFDWHSFLEGFVRCCKEGSGAARVKLLLSLFLHLPSGTSVHITSADDTSVQSQKGLDLIQTNDGGDGSAASEKGEQESVSAPPENNVKVTWDDGRLRNFLLMCRLMMATSRGNLTDLSLVAPKQGNEGFVGKSDFEAAEVEPLVQGALQAMVSQGSLSGNRETATKGALFQVANVESWVLDTLPELSGCLGDFVQARLNAAASNSASSVDSASAKETDGTGKGVRTVGEEHEVSSSTAAENSDQPTAPGLLTSGLAWALGLSLRRPLGQPGDLLLNVACCLNDRHLLQPRLLYRASLHGRGVKRCLTNVEGYRDTVLLLLSASTLPVTGDSSASAISADSGHMQRWTIGALIPGGLENKEVFYGTAGSCLWALKPQFTPVRSSGRENNFVYSHMRSPGQGYRASPKPQGVGLGGSLGKERVWIDDDFGLITVRHHAIDHTFQAGALVPGQGYAAVEGKLDEVEVWGLGGNQAEVQLAEYQQREELFAEQRRKIDMKKYAAGWESSPDKMMMDMVSNPNQPAREER